MRLSEPFFFELVRSGINTSKQVKFNFSLEIEPLWKLPAPPQKRVKGEQRMAKRTAKKGKERQRGACGSPALTLSQSAIQFFSEN
jgi:hypothetical protein